MPVEKFVDYLQYSMDFPLSFFRENEFELITPVKFYTHGYKDPFGTRYYTGNPNSSKTLVVNAGASMQKLRDSGKSDNDILRDAFAEMAKVTRLDLALTSYETKSIIFPSQIRELALQGKIKSPLAARGTRVLDYINEDGELFTETVYVGDFQKRSKKGIFRAYDKGLQLGIARDIIARLELEERQENAHKSAMRIAQGFSVSEVFASRFTIEDERFEAIIDAVPAPVVRGRAKDDETENDRLTKKIEWLISSAAPAIKEILENRHKIDNFDEKFSKLIHKSGLGSDLKAWAISLANYQIWDYNVRQETLGPTVHTPTLKGKEDE